MVVASIVVPTFRAAETLGFAVGSALRQTVRDLEVIILGDGVDAATREVALALAAADDRVRYIDLPKDPGRGEAYRDRGVREATSDAIVYLADDDILLPHHVENMLDLLARVPFAQSRNGYIDVDNILQLLPADLADADCVAWHLVDPPRNGVSLTGTAHSRQFYLGLDRGWERPPVGLWADLHMWRAFFAHPDFVGATSPEMTALQFPATIHDTRARLGLLIAAWDEFSRRADVRERMAELLAEAERRSLTQLSMATINLTIELADVGRQATTREDELAILRAQWLEDTAEHEARIASTEEQLARAHDDARILKRKLSRVRRRAAASQTELDELRASRSWRFTAPLRRRRSR